MLLYNTLKFVHVLAVILWFGGGVMLTIVGARAYRAGPDSLARVAPIGATLGSVFGPISGVAFLAGVAMMFTSIAPAWEELWIVIGVVVFFVSAVLGARLISPGWNRLAEAAESGDGGAIAAARSRLNPVIMADLTLLTVAVAAMVFKWTI